MGRRLRKAKAQWANRNLPVFPGYPGQPQGRLLSFREGGQAPLLDAQTKEAARRRQAGEANPSAPWRTPIFQHHFLGHDPVTGRPRKPPEQQRLW